MKVKGHTSYCLATLAVVAVIMMFGVEAEILRSCHPIDQVLLRFGRHGSSGSQSSRWSARTPATLRRTGQGSQQRQRYPTVQDLDDESVTSEETAKDMMNAFLTRDSRNNFIARVYAILSGQLLVTAMSILLFGLNPSLGSWMAQAGIAVPLVSLGISTVAWFVICGSIRARRESPIKWQLVSLFTLGEAVSVGFVSSFYTFRSVLSAMLATTAATGAVSLYTITQRNPKYDLSQWGAGLSSCGMIFLVYGLVHLLELFGVLPAGFLPYKESLYSFSGACLFSFYLAYHTKLVVAGKHSKYQMNEKDYVFGAMALYSDVINMFIYILRLVGEDRER